MVGVRTSQSARWPECTERMAEMGVKATRCQRMEGDDTTVKSLISF